MSPARIAIPRWLRAFATAVGDWPFMTKVKTGTRCSAVRGPSSRSPLIADNRARPWRNQLLIVTPGRLWSRRGQEIDRGSQTDRSRDVRRTCLELQRASSNDERSKSTSWAMLLPTWYGGISSSNSSRPHTTPVAIGPSTLCPENT